MNEGRGTTGTTRTWGHGSEREDDRTGIGAVRVDPRAPARDRPGLRELARREGGRARLGRARPARPLRERPASRAEWLGASWAANRFSHARVPRVMQDGVDGAGVPIVIRRWANGASLDEIVAGGVMDPTAALQLAEQLLDALEMAHAHGIIHGALSPSNVVVSARGTCALARLRDGARWSRGERRRAPSRARLAVHGAPVARVLHGDGRRTLLWPAHRAVRRLVGGRVLALRDRRQAAGPRRPSLRRAAPDAEADVVAVVDRALAINPLDRYESAYAMLGDIRRVMGGRRPKLQSAAMALPSQSAGELHGSRESTSGVVGLEAEPKAGAGTVPTSAQREPTPEPQARSSEWLGNLLLCAAIALIVALATFVLVRERLADGARARRRRRPVLEGTDRRAADFAGKAGGVPAS